MRDEGLSGEAVKTVERALNVLDRFARGRTLDLPARTALRIRMMALVDRLEIEQGKQRFLEGNFAAAQFHLSAARTRTEGSPGLARAAVVASTAAGAYLRFRPA